MRLAHGLVLLALLLSGCVKPVEPGVAAGVRTVGFHSFCAESLASGPEARVDVKADRLDDAARRAIESHVGGRVRIVPARPIIPSSTAFGVFHVDVLPSGMVADEPVDAFVGVVPIPFRGQSWPAWRSRAARGTVVVQTPGGPDIPQGNLFVRMACRLTMFDRKGTEHIAWADINESILATPTIRPLTTKKVKGARGDEVDEIDVPPIRGWSEFSPDEQSFIRGRIETILARGVAKALTEIGFPRGQ